MNVKDPAAAATETLLRPDRRGQTSQVRLRLVIRIGYLTLTSICFGLYSSRFANVTHSTPSLNSALTLLASTKLGIVKLRMNSP